MKGKGRVDSCFSMGSCGWNNGSGGEECVSFA